MQPMPTERNTGTRYPAEVKELAFEVWATRAGRKVPETARILTDMGYEVMPTTLYEWRHDQDWEHKLALEEALRQEGLVREFAGKLREVAPEAVTYLDAVAHGKVPADPVRVRAAQILVTENRHLVVALEKERMRMGNEPPEPTLDLSSLTTEELVALTME